MTRLRLLVWLVALMALIVPPGMTAHAMASAAEAMVDCAEHAPPPPCPDEGTAKHAASTCCPPMAGAVALVEPTADIDAPVIFVSPDPATASNLSGRTFTKDPPPPRG